MSERRPQVRPASGADVAAIADLFVATYGRAFDEAIYRWKVWGQPSRVATAWVAEAGGVVVGHYAGTRKWLNFRDRARAAGGESRALVETQD